MTSRGGSDRGAEEGRGSGTREIGHRHHPEAGSEAVPDMTPEQHRRRGDAADAIFREMKRKVAAKGATGRRISPAFFERTMRP
jgi:hypothetical protein